MNPQNQPVPYNSQQNANQPQIQQRTAEKIIQPLNPNLVVPSTPSSPVQPPPQLNNVNSTVTSTYDPTSTSSNYKVPTLDLRSPTEDTKIKLVAVKHKSLMILAILGLLSTCFIIYQAIQVNDAIRNAPSSANTGSAQVGLDIIYGGIIFNLIIYIYFLLAKDPHTVATILKILLVLEVISVFGVFWGGSPTKEVSLFIDATYLLFTYIVYNVVKT